MELFPCLELEGHTRLNSEIMIFVNVLPEITQIL